MIPIIERVKENRPILGDGAKGTFLVPFVENPGEPTDLLNLYKPQVVIDALRKYVDAGSQLIQTNTFRGNFIALGMFGMGDKVFEINLRGAELAREAAGKNIYVAGDIGPTGAYLEPAGDYRFEQFVKAFKPQVQGLLKGGVDLFHIETMAGIQEVLAAVTAIRNESPDIPIMATMTFEEKPKGFSTRDGINPAILRTLADEKGLLAYGANCGTGPDGASKLVEQLKGDDGGNRVLVMKLNAGLPVLVDDVIVYPKTPDDMAGHALLMYDLGVKIIGACCGSTPAHIEAMAEALARHS